MTPDEIADDSSDKKYVYTVEKTWDYETPTLVGIYANLDSAIAEATKLATKAVRGPCLPTVGEWGSALTMTWRTSKTEGIRLEKHELL
jgi:hypothetical protein